MASLRHPIMVERSQDGSGMRAWLPLSPQLVHLCVEHQVNCFMGCDYNIELFFRVLKHGCQIEQLRVQTDQRLLNAMALYLLVAWRIHNITMAGRAYPDAPCTVVFAPREWHTIDTMQHHRPRRRLRLRCARWCGP
jgi:hypothetical protein